MQWAARQLSHREGLRDARKLLAHLDQTLDVELAPAKLERFQAMVADRVAGRPIAQIIGYRDFWKHRFRVTSDTLDPRPETEHLIETALQIGVPSRALDLGTGTGCVAISLALEWPSAEVCATDISEAALAVAKENAEILGAKNLSFALGSWFEPVSGPFEIIVSNPPYIAPNEWSGLDLEQLQHEPRSALVADPDGLSAYRSIFSQAHAAASTDTWLLLEHGYQQASAIHQIAEDHGWRRKKLVPDLSGHDRISAFQIKMGISG